MRKFARFNRDRTKYGKRHVAGEMNRTESSYAETLFALKLTGEIIDWKFESIKLQIAKNCLYIPDFLVFYADCTIELVDVKGAGPIDPKSIVKIKCAAEQFPFFHFAIERRLPKGGGWKRTEY
jgi:hypothetical protein